MDRKPHDSNRITELTLRHYNQRAEAFWEGTRDHDVSQNMAAMLRHIQGEPPFTLLDFGCGPGRDLKVFANSGHVAIGLEGAPRFVEMAREHSGCDVWLQDFLKLDLPDDFFDGDFRECDAFSRAQRRVAARASGIARFSQAGRRSLQFDTARR